MTLVILAAGSGSRYGGLKQFDGVGPGGEYLMDYNMFDAIEAGFSKIVVITKPELIEETTNYLETHLPSNVEFECLGQSVKDLPKGIQSIDERQKPWGTAHAIWCVRDSLSGKFVTINADDLYGKNAFKVAFEADTSAFGSVAYSLKNTLSANGTVSRGVCQHENDHLREVVEYIKIYFDGERYVDQSSGQVFDGSELVSMNMWILDSTIFPHIEQHFKEFLNVPGNHEKGEILLPTIIQEMIEDGKEVKVYDSQSQWLGLTYTEDREEVRKKLRNYVEEDIYPSPLWK